MKQPRDYALMLLRKAANDLIAADAILQTGRAGVGFTAHCATVETHHPVVSQSL